MGLNFNSETVFLGHHKGKAIIDVLTENLNECESFTFSVSFIRQTGLNLLKKSIIQALNRGAKGRIITTDYMSVTQESCLQELLSLQEQFPNFSVYLLETSERNDYKSFHTKGYIFISGNVASVIIGSSNISDTALTKKGGEWSLFSKTYSDNFLYSDIEDELNLSILNIKQKLSQEQIDRYTQSSLLFESFDVKPNLMQQEALNELNKLRRNLNKNKALIVAAMGSGKTYLSAFDAKNEGANRILYICHSQTVLEKAMTEYQNVFKEKSCGLFVDMKKAKSFEILFSTNLRMINHLNEFDPKYFDYIVIDEAHHAPASTYAAIIKHFKPNFLLGMTGTPDRMDQKSAVELFGSQVPYELDLRKAIEAGLIMPFKYCAIYDEDLDYSNSVSDSDIVSKMVDSNHVSFIKNQIESHRNEINGKLKCLAFCVSVDHAKKMAEAFKVVGYNAAFVTGETEIHERNKIYSDLQDEKEPLEIVCSINVMNEGVDLPKVNMSLFLRPTDSSIIFIQQLGRILRKAENKLRPLVLDFIGCKYARSTFIAWALGSFSDTPILTKPILKEILKGNIIGSGNDSGIVISIDEKSETQIDEYIDKQNFNSLNILKNIYRDTKKQFANIAYPSHCDFLEAANSFDLTRIIKTNKSYFKFLRRIKEINVPTFSSSQEAFFDYLSEMLPISRIYEFKIIQTLIQRGPTSPDILFSFVKESIESDYSFNKNSYEHAIKYLSLETYSEKQKQTNFKYLKKDNEGKFYLDIELNDYYLVSYNGGDISGFNETPFVKAINDILSYGLRRYSNEHSTDGSSFELFKAYSRKEFTRLGCFKSVYSPQPGLVAVDDTMALFIDLIKDKDDSDNLNYADKFLSKSTINWESQTGTVIGQKKYKKLMSWKKYVMFVRKVKKEDGINLPYIFLGECTLSDPVQTENKGKTVSFKCTLKHELTDELFKEFNIDLKK